MPDPSDFLRSVAGIAWMTTLLCTIVTAVCANTWARYNPRIFVAQALFAMHWALLLTYYAGPHDEMIPAFAGLLLIFVGGPLRREGETRRRHGTHEKVARLDRYALSLLLLLVTPRVINETGPKGGALASPAFIVAWLGTALTLIGFYSVAHGVAALTNNRKWQWLAGFLVAYGGLEIAFSATASPALLHKGDAAMSDRFYILFSIAKCVFTLLFLLATVPETKRFHCKRWGALIE